MVAERLSMRKVKDVLRLEAEGRSDREIAQSLRIGRATVGRYRKRAEEAGLTWALLEGLSDSQIEARLFPPLPPPNQPRALPDWRHVYKELGRKHVTLRLLWEEYRATHSDGYRYSRFCELFREWKDSLEVVLRQEYKAGEKLFVDYAGHTMPVIDPDTGEIRQAEIFVGTLGASNYTYVEATWTQSLPDWTASHVGMFAYFGGVSELVIPDNLRSAVKQACRYDPDKNPTYQDLATHYGTAVLPARQRAPRDKAKVEAGVQNVERWILAPLRNHTFFSLAELNQEIWRLLEKLNERPFQKLEGSRRSLFEALERPALKPLPQTPYEFAEWKKATVSIDYHVSVEMHNYSVPYQLKGVRLDVRLTATTLEAFHDGRRVAGHPRSYRRGGYTTEPAHRPKAHQEHLDWTPSRIIRWAEKTGPNTATVVRRIFEERPHPEQGYRPCLGILRLGKSYGEERLEAACKRAAELPHLTYRSIRSILQSGLDRFPDQDEQITLQLPQQHENLRGPDYYNTLN